MEVPRGRMVGLLGPNGSGKSTFFKLLTGLIRLAPTGGTLDILGHRIPAEARLARRRVGVVFQSPSLDPQLTVREVMRLQAKLYGLSRADTQSAIERWAGILSISDRLDERTGKLSGGLKRRCELAKAMLHEPDLLLLDEPSTGLDVAARRELGDTLDQLCREQHRTVLITTHLMDEAERCDQVLCLSEGRVVASGTPHELSEKVGGTVLRIRPSQADQSALIVQELIRFTGVDESAISHVAGMVMMSCPEVDLSALYANLSAMARSITVGAPTLEDVFIRLTGAGLID